MTHCTDDKVVPFDIKLQAHDFPVSKDEFDKEMKDSANNAMLSKRTIFFLCAFALAVVAFLLFKAMLDVQLSLYTLNPQLGAEALSQLSIDVSRKASYFLFFSALVGLTAVGLFCLGLITKIARIEIKVSS